MTPSKDPACANVFIEPSLIKEVVAQRWLPKKPFYLGTPLYQFRRNTLDARHYNELEDCRAAFCLVNPDSPQLNFLIYGPAFDPVAGRVRPHILVRKEENVSLRQVRQLAAEETKRYEKLVDSCGRIKNGLTFLCAWMPHLNYMNIFDPHYHEARRAPLPRPQPLPSPGP